MKNLLIIALISITVGLSLFIFNTDEIGCDITSAQVDSILNFDKNNNRLDKIESDLNEIDNMIKELNDSYTQ